MSKLSPVSWYWKILWMKRILNRLMTLVFSLVTIICLWNIVYLMLRYQKWWWWLLALKVSWHCVIGICIYCMSILVEVMLLHWMVLTSLAHEIFSIHLHALINLCLGLEFLSKLIHLLLSHFTIWYDSPLTIEEWVLITYTCLELTFSLLTFLGWWFL